MRRSSLNQDTHLPNIASPDIQRNDNPSLKRVSITQWSHSRCSEIDEAEPPRSLSTSRVRRSINRNRPILGITGDRYVPEDSIFQGEFGVVKVNRPVYTQNHFNEEYEDRVNEGQTMRFLDNVFMPRKEKLDCLDFLLSIFPLVNVMRLYNFKASLPLDLLSGVTTGVMRIPQSMAYGLLTSLAPEYGLYTAFFSAVFYAIFGGSPHMVAGVQGVVALIIGDGVHTFAARGNSSLDSGEDDYLNRKLEVAITITFMIGIIQCIMGICRLGFITNYLSDPLIGGFTTAAAVVVIVTQLPIMLGIKLTMASGYFNLYHSLVDIFSKISQTNYHTVIISIICFGVLVLSKYLTSRFIARIKIPIPGELIVMIAMILVSHFLGIEKRWDVKLVGTIKQGFPPVRLPKPQYMLESLSASFSGAIVSFTIAYSVAKTLAVKHDYEIDSNREAFSFGFINCVGAFFNIFAVTASMVGSALHEALGGVSQLANLIASVLILLTFLFAGKLFEPIPECVLSTVILINLKSILFQFGDLKRLWKVSKFDFLLWTVTFCAVVIVSVNIGLLIGVGFSLATIVFRTQWPYSCILGRIPSTDIYKNVSLTSNAIEIPGIKIIRFEGSLYFASADHFREAVKHVTGINPAKIVKEQNELERKLLRIKEQTVHFLNQNDEFASSSSLLNDHSKKEAIDLTGQIVHHVIIDFSTCSFIDSVGIRTLIQVIRAFKSANITIFLANVRAAVRAMFSDCGVMYQCLSPDEIFLSVHDAVLGALEDERLYEERNDLLKDSINLSRVNSIQD